MAVVSATLANERKVSKLISDIVKRVEKPRPVFEWVADNVLLPALVGQFKTEGARGGRKWKNYTQAEKASGYVGYKKAITGKSNPILDWDGPGARMRPSFTEPSHPEHVRKVTNHSAAVGSRVPWAANHNEGNGKGWGGGYTIPKRPITVLNTRTDVVTIVDATHEYATTGKIRNTRAVR